MRAASYGSGGASTAREDQDNMRERGKQGGTGYRARLEALGRAYHDGGMTIRLGDSGFFTAKLGRQSWRTGRRGGCAGARWGTKQERMLSI